MDLSEGGPSRDWCKERRGAQVLCDPWQGFNLFPFSTQSWTSASDLVDPGSFSPEDQSAVTSDCRHSEVPPECWRAFLTH